MSSDLHLKAGAPASESTTRPAAAEATPPARGPFWELLESFRGELGSRLEEWLRARRAEITAEAPEAAELVGKLDPYVLGRGKRLRPALLYYAYRGCGGDAEWILRPSMAVELLHTYLLIHDDIMDRAETRRGQPSAHVAFAEDHRRRRWGGSPDRHGQSVAILLGDLAYSYAVELFHAAADEGGSGAEVRRCFATMCREVIVGQYLELTAGYRSGLTEEDLLRVLRMKSGRYSMQRPVELGALMARAPEETVADLSRVGSSIGEAFQLQDDLLGMFGDSREVGKPVGSDLAENKYTVLIHATLERAGAADAALVRAALGNPALSRSEVERVQAIIRDSGAERRVLGMIEERLSAAARRLAGLELAPEGRMFFEGLADYLRKRRW